MNDPVLLVLYAQQYILDSGHSLTLSPPLHSTAQHIHSSGELQLSENMWQACSLACSRKYPVVLSLLAVASPVQTRIVGNVIFWTRTILSQDFNNSMPEACYIIQAAYSLSRGMDLKKRITREVFTLDRAIMPKLGFLNFLYQITTHIIHSPANCR